VAENKLYQPLFLELQAKKAHAETKKYLAKIKNRNPRNLDNLFLRLHSQAFKKTNCLECANCCKSLGPRLTNKDIERLSKSLRMKESEFIDTYLKVDEDNDHVFKTMPCPFLAPDNYCRVYENRPKACREYPHTDAPKMIKHLNLALKNAETCPAVFLILEDLKQIPPGEIK
jgi:Fe-S-cluster containining protein